MPLHSRITRRQKNLRAHSIHERVARARPSTTLASTAYFDAVMADSPLLLWKLTESSGTAAADSSGNARGGTYINTPTLAASTPVFPDDTKAPYFNGSRVEGDANLVSDGSWTIECWFNRDAFKAGQSGGINALIGDLINNANGVLARWNGDVNTLTCYIAYNGGYDTVTSTANYDTHYHYAVTSTGAVVTPYVNGVAGTPVNTASAGFNMKWQVAGIGTGGGQIMYQTGYVGWVAVYSTALSAARIAAHYAAG